MSSKALINVVVPGPLALVVYARQRTFQTFPSNGDWSAIYPTTLADRHLLRLTLFGVSHELRYVNEIQVKPDSEVPTKHNRSHFSSPGEGDLRKGYPRLFNFV